MLSSCYVLNTELEIKTELKAYAVIEGQTPPGYVTEVTIAPGTYQGQFVSTSQTSLNFYTEIDGIKFYLPVTMPSGAINPYNGMFDVSAEKAGQPWGYKGQIIRSHYDSDSKTAIEECSYIVYRNVCRRIPEADGSYREVCRPEGHMTDGTQQVEYVERYINEHFVAKLKSDANPQLGKFEGDRDTMKKIYSFKEECH